MKDEVWLFVFTMVLALSVLILEMKIVGGF